MSIEMWMSHLRTPAECHVNKPLLFEKINTSPKTLDTHTQANSLRYKVPKTLHTPSQLRLIRTYAKRNELRYYEPHLFEFSTDILKKFAEIPDLVWE